MLRWPGCEAYARLGALVGIAFGLLALVAACGDGARIDSTSAGIVERQSADNAIYTSHSENFETKGSFESFEGYLSKGGYVLRTVGSDFASATFSVAVPRSGYYGVFASWPQTGNEGSVARVSISQFEKTHATRLDQSMDGGDWISLGNFRFESEAPVKIAFLREGVAPMLVDAVRIQYVGETRPPLELKAAELSVAEQGRSYLARLQGAGGAVPYTFRVSDGTLPAGLSIDGASGIISGIAAYVGEVSFSVEIADSLGNRSTRQVAIHVVPISDPVDEQVQAAKSLQISKKTTGSPAAKSGSASLVSILEGMGEGEWKKVNLNSFSDVWAPADLRPLLGWGNPAPAAIIRAWSSFAWDSNRGDLILYGGGHANYRGNEVYIWRGSSQLWERASLPSEMVVDSLGNWNAIDSADRAPASAHTYDNTVFLPVVDRVLVLGGAADSNGGHYLRQATATTSRITGPYLFDPSRSDPWKVGGTTGSHVKRVSPYPEILGGEMWSNRENGLNASPMPSRAFTNACAAYARENGKDVVYVRNYNLYRYTLHDLNDPTRDTWETVGVFWGGPGSKTACGYDPVGKSFVRLATNQVPFVYWNLNTPGSGNRDIKLVPEDPTGEFPALLASNAIQIPDCGLDFDPSRGKYVLWCGDGRVWMMKPSASLSPTGWIIEKQRTPVGQVPNGDVGTGVLGKWKYAADLDAFVGLQDVNQGNVWLYKPVGWKSPGGGGGETPPNASPEVFMQQPAQGSVFNAGQSVPLLAIASDSDGTIASVTFYDGAMEIGEVSSPPYAINWGNAPVGEHTVTAVARDNVGASATSAPVTFSVAPSGGGGSDVTVNLQNGVEGYAGTADTYLSQYHKSLSFGTATYMYDQGSNYPVLLRFAIFRSEGGPVPEGATIRSAKLYLYKYSAYDTLYTAHRLLKNWSEAATWNDTGIGSGWAVAGANGAGADFQNEPDATASAPWDPDWVEFDLTASVQRMSDAGGIGNFGWRLNGVSGTLNGIKRFYSSEHAGDSALRPKLVVTYR